MVRLRTFTRGETNMQMMGAALDELGVAVGEQFVVAPLAVLQVEDGAVRARATDPQTSRDAARALGVGRAGSHRHTVMLLILGAEPYGLTSRELTVRVNFDAWKRLSELKDRGFVRASGQRRATDRGSEADVYVATERARAAYDAGLLSLTHTV